MMGDRNIKKKVIDKSGVKRLEWWKCSGQLFNDLRGSIARSMGSGNGHNLNIVCHRCAYLYCIVITVSLNLPCFPHLHALLFFFVHLDYAYKTSPQIERVLINLKDLSKGDPALRRFGILMVGWPWCKL